MKKILTFILIFSLLAIYAQSQVSIIPQPVKMELKSGTLVVDKAYEIGYNKPDAKLSAEMLSSKLSVPTGFAFMPKEVKNAFIQLNLNEQPDNLLGKEGYTLNVSTTGIVINANKPAGLFYGVQSLIQLFPAAIESKSVQKIKWEIPCVSITDFPRFGWRGLMLDVSRHFFSKEEVKAYIDQMAKYKYNVFHWHLTDDNGWRIEIKSLPKLTEIGAWRVERFGAFGDRANPKEGEKATYGGFYTHDDVREIIKYADERNITIVPEIDVPGHSMAAIASYPELCCTKDPKIKVNPGTDFSEWYGNGKFKMLIDNTLNPADEKVYEFLDKVFTELAALFPNPYIHVGGDECYKGYWEKNPACQALMKKEKLQHVEQLQGYFMKRLEVMLKTKGKKLLGWDEILEGGIGPEATVMSWRGIEGGIQAAKMKHDVVMTPTIFAYLDYVQGDLSIESPVYASLRTIKSYSFEPVPEGVDAQYILGGQGNLWTEQIPTLRYAQYMTYPRAWALSEVYWTPKENKDWKNFAQRMENHFERSDFSGVNYSKAVYDPIIRIKKDKEKIMVEMESEFPGLEIYYTIDGTMPDNYAIKYDKPFQLPEGKITLKAVSYRNGNKLGNLLILKPEDIKRRAE
ncbi:MAG: family 20 glycosylhydrolase [Bacteroidales bacterium]